MREVLIALLLVGSGMAGCLGQLDDDPLETESDDGATDESSSFVPEAPDHDFTDAMDPNHPDHHLPQLHENSYGLEQVGHQDFMGFYPPHYQGGWGEVDVHGDLAAVASVDGPLGLTLVDISDPSSPEPLSYITSWGGEFDGRFTDDGNYLVFGCQVGSILGQGAYAAGDCKGNTGPGDPAERTEPIGADGVDSKNSVVAYDVSDPENPEQVAYTPTQGAHNVFTATINGTIYVFTDAVEILRFTPEAPEGERLTEVATVQGTHDVAVQKHPVTDNWVLYTGSPEDDSLAIYDLEDPAAPHPLTKTVPGAVAWHEQTPVPTTVDGRALVIGGGETFSSTGDAGDASRQRLSIVDVTDPADPKTLANWTLPISEQLPYANYRYSAHNVDVTPTGQVAASWYHAGIWVFDISTQERQENPVTLGFYQPHETHSPVAPATFAQLDHAMVPLVWGGQWTDEGRLVVGDLYTGVYTLEPEWGLLPGSDTTAS